MRDVLQVALLQTAPLLGEVDKNLEQMHDLLRQIPQADVAVAAELALHGYRLGLLDDFEALELDDPRLAELGQHGPVVVAGFVEARRHDQYNSAVVVDGELVQAQRKLFLPTYRGWEERKHFRPGAKLRRFDLRGTNVAVLVCNDLWQPPVPWLAAHAGAEVIIVIASSSHSESAVPVQRAWDVLITHTAVTLQCYVVFVNRVGNELDLDFWGGSYVVGPDGEKLLELGEEAEVGEVRLDLQVVRTLRRRWPLLREPRLDLIAAELHLQMAEEE
jgi:predicted amidohydrolase